MYKCKGKTDDKTAERTVAGLFACDAQDSNDKNERQHDLGQQTGDRVSAYAGQTALKTQEVIQKAMGGILFIDEAYALANKSDNDYGNEAIDTILKAMEDHRDDLILIVAGYPEKMEGFWVKKTELKNYYDLMEGWSQIVFNSVYKQ